MERIFVGQKNNSAKIAIDIISFVLHLLLNIVFYAMVIFAIYKVGITTREFCYQVFGEYTMDAEPGINAEITIKEGASTMEIAASLEMNRLIPNRYTFYLRVKLMGYNIMAGTYHLNTSMTYGEILEQITNYSNAIVQEE